MEDDLKSLVFHHYVPKDENLKRLVRSNLEDYKEIEEDIDDTINRIIEEYAKKDVLSLVLPSKQNYDLKRNLRVARQILATKTDQTIMKFLKANKNKEGISAVMLPQLNQSEMERNLSDEDEGLEQ